MISSFDNVIAFISMPGGVEWIVVLVVALLIFGKRLPGVAKNLGKSLTSFKKGLKDIEDVKDDVKKEVDNVKNDIVNETKKSLSEEDSDKDQDA